jgi:hypothetical protein
VTRAESEAWQRLDRGVGSGELTQTTGQGEVDSEQLLDTAAARFYALQSPA